MAEPYAQLRVLTTEGPKVVEVQDSDEASRVGEHWNAIKHFLNTGDETRLRGFDGETVAGVVLETDPDAIEEWARTGEIDFEEIYQG